ncbi:guanine nucleotide-binding protein subunit gamma-1-like [Dermatophagoides farinae]|uniref:Guanine nucleotide-binding protein subunit gamma-1 n=1 Tax=Dermatophagoides farinae TaxID=6954 RepID=A0A922I2Q6_DERFA|nr:guanine nucleotide-binding protein subunit gamma-1-like protein [Dermatophagoides farinae]KAH9517980.1 Guanine nucleotide-binding protein subunit gamma-1 [Dermatophagoides farinae]
MSSLTQQRRVVEQLRRESHIKRIMVSVAVEDLKKYVLEHATEDCLLVGFHSQKANPFREKSSCVLL